MTNEELLLTMEKAIEVQDNIALKMLLIMAKEKIEYQAETIDNFLKSFDGRTHATNNH